MCILADYLARQLSWPPTPPSEATASIIAIIVIIVTITTITTIIITIIVIYESCRQCSEAQIPHFVSTSAIMCHPHLRKRKAVQ